MLLVQIFPTLSHHSALSSITSSRSSRLHPVSILSYYCKVLVNQPTLAHLSEGVHRETSLMCSTLLFQQCPACLVHFVWMVLEMGGRWPYSCCFMGCCFQDLFKVAHIILVQFLCSFFSIRLVDVHVMHPYNRSEKRHESSSPSYSQIWINSRADPVC